MQGTPVLTELDPSLNFDFVHNTPPNFPFTTNFSARWTGQITPQYTENYVFLTYSDDGVRVIVNGQTVIDNYSYHSPTLNWNWMQLQAGKTYDIEVDYFQGLGDAILQVWWESPTQKPQFFAATQPVAQNGPKTYYVSANGYDGNTGLSPNQAWASVSRVNSQPLNPGDQILFERGGRFVGRLNPSGSGTSDAPLSIGAYGSGALPIIDGGGQEEAVRLFNQQYWNIDSLDVTGGAQYGVFVSGDATYQTLHHIHLSNLRVHDIYSSPRWDSGLVMVAPIGDHLTFDDVLVDTVTAFNTNLWYGIHVGFNLWNSYPVNPPMTTNVVVRNSTVHDVYGDGITAAQSRNVLIEKNVVSQTGLAPSGVSYTPNGIWTWQCDTATIQYNEGYATHSYAWDGGVFDIDWGSTNTTIQYNYAHDADGYCIAVMGAHNITTSNSIVRFNVCSNNGRRADRAPWQGDIFVTTFDGGSLDGVQIYNNTDYWNPSVNMAWLSGRNVNVTGNRPRFLMNNLVYSTTSAMLDLDNSFGMDRDMYWLAGGGTPVWKYGSAVATNLNDFRSWTGQDWNGIYGNPMLNNPAYHAVGRPVTDLNLQWGSPAIGSGLAWDMGGTDFFGHSVPSGGSINIGANNVLPQ